MYLGFIHEKISFHVQKLVSFITHVFLVSDARKSPVQFTNLHQKLRGGFFKLNKIVNILSTGDWFQELQEDAGNHLRVPNFIYILCFFLVLYIIMI